MASNFRRILNLLAYLTVFQVCLVSSDISAPKVKLDLYYESLCPYCSNFIINGIPMLFENGLIDIVDLRLFPWGNARMIPNNSFICQHGPNECLFNTIEACAIDAWPKLEEHFPIIFCVENQLYEGEYNKWETCFKKLALDPKPVTSCYKGESGLKLNLKYAALTASLEPPHEYVPWVVVDGKPLLEDYGNFMSYICKAYKGTPPNACYKASVLRKQTNHVCYAKQIAELPLVSKIWSFISSWMDQIA